MTGLTLGAVLFGEGTWPEMLAAIRRIDHLGYHHLWAWDHLLPDSGDPQQPIFEGWTTLGAWAMATERVRLGLLVGANTLRNPGLVANSVTTLDHISGGRAILGLGAGSFELEHRAYGIEFGSGFGERCAWLDEAALACRLLLDGETVSSAPGDHYAFEALRENPEPIQARLPIMIGGSGEKKTLRTVARYADLWNTHGSPAALAHLDAVLRRHCADVGRDHREIERTVDCLVVIRDTQTEAQGVFAKMMTRSRTPMENWEGPDILWLGPPQAIADEIHKRMAVGFDTFIVELPAPYDAETIERLIGEVKPLVDAMLAAAPVTVRLRRG